MGSGLGVLDDQEREALGQRAHEVLRHCDWTEHLEATGAIVTAPASAAEMGRAQREADRIEWQRVLEAL